MSIISVYFLVTGVPSLVSVQSLVTGVPPLCFGQLVLFTRAVCSFVCQSTSTYLLVNKLKRCPQVLEERWNLNENFPTRLWRETF